MSEKIPPPFMKKILPLCLLFTFTLPNLLLAQEDNSYLKRDPTEFAPKITKLQPGTKDRKLICNAFRKPMSKVVRGQKIVFVISSLNVYDNYAFILCSLQLSSGKAVDWSKTQYKDDFNAGDLENNAVGLLKKNSQGEWIVLESSFSNTDAWYISWADYYSLPPALFR